MQIRLVSKSNVCDVVFTVYLLFTIDIHPSLLMVIVSAAIEIKQLCRKCGVGSLFLVVVLTSVLKDAFNEFSCSPIIFKLCHVRKTLLDLRAVD